MPTTPPADAPLPPRERLAQLRDTYGTLPRARRELIIYGAALLFGVLLMPLLVWVVGNRLLGPYTHGQNPHAVFWAVALGPAVVLLLVRLLLRLVRALPSARDE
jgi:hypothetical protein